MDENEKDAAEDTTDVVDESSDDVVIDESDAPMSNQADALSDIAKSLSDLQIAMQNGFSALNSMFVKNGGIVREYASDNGTTEGVANDSDYKSFEELDLTL